MTQHTKIMATDLTDILISGVTGVTGVTGPKLLGNSVTQAQHLEGVGVTSGVDPKHLKHPVTQGCVTRKPAENLAVTRVTPVTPQNHDALIRATEQGWRNGIASLDPERPRANYHWRRWDNLVADCVLIFNDFGERAAATGWTAEDLFGVDPAGAGGSIVGGLAWRLEGRKLLTVESGMATFQYRNGAIGRCSRGWVRGLVPVWELGE